MGDLLDVVLAEATDLGFLTAHPVVDHRRHAERFVAVIDKDGPVVDLGTGGGVPGLVVAVAMPERDVILVERGERRAAFLRGAVGRLGLASVQVVAADAAVAARDHSGVAAIVTARSFGPPAATAECAVPYLALGARLIVSEPPGGDSIRWPPAGLAGLGLELTSVDTGPPALAVLTRTSEPTVALPRAPGLAHRRPLF